MSASYRVSNPEAPKRVADPHIAERAHRVMSIAVSESPRETGELADGYRVERLGDSHYAVVNDVPYARFVEYGTTDMRAEPAFGRAIAEVRGAA